MAIAIDDRGSTIMIEIPISIALLDHDGVAAVAVLTLADHVTIAVPISVTMTATDGHANRADAHADFFRTGRHRKTDCGRRNSHHCKTLDHYVLLRFVPYRRPIRADLNCSGRKFSGKAPDHGFIANQLAIAMIAATMAAHITGVTRFELPLRGESLAA